MDVLSGLPTSWEDNKSLEDDVPLLAIDMMNYLGEIHIWVVDTTKDAFIPLDRHSTEASLNSPPTERESLLEKALDTHFETATLQVECQRSWSTQR